MPRKTVPHLLEKDLPVTFTDKAITAFGGLSLFARFCRRIGLADSLSEALPDEKLSNNSISSVEIALAFMVGVLRGATRFAHVAWLRLDVPLQEIFGFTRPPSSSSVTRFFGMFRRVHVEHLWETLSSLVWSRIPAPRWGHTLDLDSTVFVRYGNQEGSKKGYNPKKRGRPSHHPLMAFLAECKLVLHVWLRSGNTHTARGVVAFFREAVALLPASHILYAVRADSGFCQDDFLTELEDHGTPYAIATKFTPTVKHLAASQVGHWRQFGPGLEVGETTYQALGWKRTRRLVMVRELVKERPDARGRKLFDCPGYTFHAFVTTLDWSPETVWRFYNSRADAENRIKEIAEHYNANAFCVRNFYGTEAALRIICFLFNLMAIFKRDVVGATEPMLNRLRMTLFAAGSLLGMEQGHSILRIGLKGILRERFTGMLKRLEALYPTASQLPSSERET